MNIATIVSCVEYFGVYPILKDFDDAERLLTQYTYHIRGEKHL
tara:strand:- start:169 stop:297 length:129 start_codon:yes stop_codon:yes gene_type:complete